MFDVFTRLVSQADAHGSYLTSEQFSGLKNTIAEGNKRMDAVNRIRHLPK